MECKVYGLSSVLEAVGITLSCLKNKVQASSLCILLLLELFTGCATMRLPDYEARSLSSYKNVNIQNKLSLAINPLTDRQEIEQYFGMDLLSVNILPVLVVAENNNPISSFILSKERVFLKNKNEQGDSKRADQKGATSSSSGEATVIAGSASVLIIPILAPVIMLVGGKMISDAAVIKHNLAVKELQNRTISPGKSIQGFVYFQVPKEAHPLRDWLILVEAIEINTNNVHAFEFNLN